MLKVGYAELYEVPVEPYYKGTQGETNVHIADKGNAVVEYFTTTRYCHRYIFFITTSLLLLLSVNRNFALEINAKIIK